MNSENESYAIIEASGKQYKVSAGTRIEVDLMPGEVGETVKFDRVLLLSSGGDTKIGTPHVAGASVSAKVLGTKKGAKLVAFKKRRRKGYTRKIGHRQEHKLLLIESIAGN